jgi:hypothetical protein
MVIVELSASGPHVSVCPPTRLDDSTCSAPMFRFAFLILAAIAIEAAQSREAPFGYATEQSVREACGESWKSNDRAFGCTVVHDGEVRDYSCHNDSKNGHVGCRVLFHGTAPKPGTGTSGLSTGR